MIKEKQKISNLVYDTQVRSCSNMVKMFGWVLKGTLLLFRLITLKFRNQPTRPFKLHLRTLQCNWKIIKTEYYTHIKIGFKWLQPDHTHKHLVRKGTLALTNINFRPVLLNGWVFLYELSGCNHLNFRYHICFEQWGPWHSGNYIV